MIPKISRDQVETEARAKILWGEEPITVLAYLRSNGLTQDEAVELMEAFQAERRATVRGNAVKKIAIGGTLILVPIGAYFVLMTGPIMLIKSFALTVAVGLAGLWMLADGILKLVSPDSQKGDLADQSD